MKVTDKLINTNMRQKTLISCLAIAAGMIITSCGGSKKENKEIVLKPATTEVSGDMEGCFEVVDRQYKAIGDIYKLISVEVKRTDEELPFELGSRELWSYSESGIMAAVKVGFGIEFLDADGNVLDKVSASGSGFSGSYSPDEAKDIIKLKEGRTNTIRFKVNRDAEKAISFRLTSAFEEHEGQTSSSSSSSRRSSASNSTSGGTSDVDAVLDSYEEYVDSYIKLLKKAKAGDLSAMSEYGEMLQHATELQEKLDKSKGDFSAAQLKRFNKIISKMATGLN